ncbi:unnamed protein product [Knipowitschia caucasica]
MPKMKRKLESFWVRLQMPHTIILAEPASVTRKGGYSRTSQQPALYMICQKHNFNKMSSKSACILSKPFSWDILTLCMSESLHKIAETMAGAKTVIDVM